MADESAIAARLSQWVHLDPGAAAIGGVGGPVLSRRELSDLIRCGTGYLRGAGLGPTDRVAVLLPEGFAAAVSVLQVAGACSLAPLRPTLGAAGWDTALRNLAPQALVVSQDWPEAARAARALAIRVIDPDELCSTPTSAAVEAIGSAGSELLLATSGSTGTPKWVRIPQERMVRGSIAMSRCMRLTPYDRALLALPLTHAHGLASGLLLPLLSGGSVVVSDSFDPERFLKDVADHAVTWFTAAPAMHRALLEQHAVTPLSRDHKLRFVRSGTVSLPPAVIDSLLTEFGVPVIEAYGMTESPHITCNPADAPRSGSVGRPVIEELAVIGTDGRQVPTGDWGQVVLRGAPLMTGYLDPAADANMFRGGWLQTGDEGRLDDDGYLYLRGRICERINRGGAMVAPADVDAMLLTHPGVRQAVAFPVQHPSLGQDLAAAVVIAAGSSISEAQLRDYLSSRMEPRQVPSAIILTDSIPVGSAGKVVRGGLAASFERSLHPAYEEPENPLEAMIVEWFSAVLAPRSDIDRSIGRATNFFLAGGDSLTAIQIIARIARAGFGERSPALIYRHPTPAELARAVQSDRLNDALSGLVLLQPTGDRAPLFVVHGLDGELFNYVELPAEFDSERPVFGVQATGYSAEQLSRMTVQDLAHRHARAILSLGLQGPVHLVGFSAGAWYAHAVAAALIERGAEIGLCALIDGHAISRLHPRAHIALLWPRIREHVDRWTHPPDGQSPLTYLNSVVRNRAHRIRIAVYHRFRPRAATEAATAREVTSAMLNPFKLLLQRGYRPQPLPIAADLIGPQHTMAILKATWSHYVTRGSRNHCLFDDHKDFMRPDRMPELAAVLKQSLARVEREGSTTPCSSRRIPSC